MSNEEILLDLLSKRGVSISVSKNEENSRLVNFSVVDGHSVLLEMLGKTYSVILFAEENKLVDIMLGRTGENSFFACFQRKK